MVVSTSSFAPTSPCNASIAGPEGEYDAEMTEVETALVAGQAQNLGRWRRRSSVYQEASVPPKMPLYIYSLKAPPGSTLRVSGDVEALFVFGKAMDERMFGILQRLGSFIDSLQHVTLPSKHHNLFEELKDCYGKAYARRDTIKQTLARQRPYLAEATNNNYGKDTSTAYGEVRENRG